MTVEGNIYAQGQVLLIDKPLEWTSFNVISKVRYLTKTRKVGHAGTLDPLATGLLIVCTGKFTKRINEFMAQEKEYTGIITLGAVTPTYDLESEPEQFKSVEGITTEKVETVVHGFTGNILQTPPAHSAIKIGGKRVYSLARAGKEVKLESRPVHIALFQTTLQLPYLHFKVVCSTGTYIRSLANDVGAALGCGGYLSALRRTRIGNYHVADALTIDQLEATIKF